MSIDNFKHGIEGLSRKCLSAIEDKSQLPSRIRSMSGGGFFDYPDETWPTFKGKSLIPILSIYTPDLPLVPENLKAFELLNIFAYDEPYEWEDEKKGAIIVDSFTSTDELVKLTKPIEIVSPEIPIKWIEEIDYPSQIQGFTEELFSFEDEILEKFPHQEGIKIGGYPTCIQSYFNTPEYVFQFSYKSNYPFNEVFMFGDGGVVHFNKKRGVDWEIYCETS